MIRTSTSQPAVTSNSQGTSRNNDTNYGYSSSSDTSSGSIIVSSTPMSPSRQQSVGMEYESAQMSKFQTLAHQELSGIQERSPSKPERELPSSQDPTDQSNEPHRSQRGASARKSHSRSTNRAEDLPRRSVGSGRIRGLSSRRGNIRRYRAGVRARMEIQGYKKSADFLTQKLPFSRAVREIALKFGRRYNIFRWEVRAIEALQEAAEMYLSNLFEVGMLRALRQRRATPKRRDLQPDRSGVPMPDAQEDVPLSCSK